MKITTYAGRETVAATDHPFLTPDGWVKAADLVPGASVASVPSPAYEPDSALTADAAYLLGAFVGDGSTGKLATTHHCAITCFSDSMAVRLQECADSLGFVMNLSGETGRVRRFYSFRSKSRRQEDQAAGPRRWLAEHGLAGCTSRTKRVPPAVFRSTPEVIASFIAGYWDCDGTVSTRGKNRDGTPRTDVLVELYSVSRPLLEDVQHLLLRLGMRSTIRQKIGKLNGVEHLSYRLALISRDEVTKFRTLIPLAADHKAARLADHFAMRSTFDAPLMADEVVSVEPVGPLPCRCLTVEGDHTFTSDDLVVHNSELASVYAPAWWLLCNPEQRVVISTYADHLAREKGREVRAVLAEHGRRFGTGLRRGSASVTDWRTTQGGGLRSVGVGGSLTGFPASLALVDDPHKDREHADSKVMRARVWKWWSSVLTSRLAPGASACLIMTRWHPSDLAGMLLDREGRIEDGGRWRVLELPAYAVEGDPLGRAPGDPLPHPQIAEDDVAGARAHWEAQRDATTIPRDWQALYMCSPTAGEGALVPASLLVERRVPFGHVLPGAVQRAVAVDPSGGGKDEAGLIAGFAGTDHRLYLTHDWSGRMSSEEWARKACLLAAETNADTVVVERNYGGDMPRRMINLAWRSLAAEGRVRARHSPYVVEVTARQGKHIRAEPVAQMIVEDMVRLVRPLPELELEWSTWAPSATGTSPGRLDASVYLALKLVPYISPEPGR
ncbi:LAGLIDADG family homing endonuclease [Streptomyces sp. CAI-85]|uniref:LAGLIDADG family homing endonuclease n=1 Tax=Streptomyces sp. CAI-85 TaxID=1472662 RepID=UPI0015875D04|nr:LAGLIDADG family homing endonuclease [Streptomyces sp. CAI-85]NUV64314.1 hypothetical protein [Streptomyces sp. CAI-85]